jgi:C4-dicarboxylate-specific signal transduction histidine kinase
MAMHPAYETMFEAFYPRGLSSKQRTKWATGELIKTINASEKLGTKNISVLSGSFAAMSGIDDRPRQLMISTARDDDDRLRVVMQDAGVGLDPETADRLFEAFYTTKSSGMGIGLSVSRSIIERHHGRIWGARNDGPGATFSFSIPRAPECLPDGTHMTRDS